MAYYHPLHNNTIYLSKIKSKEKVKKILQKSHRESIFSRKLVWASISLRRSLVTTLRPLTKIAKQLLQNHERARKNQPTAACSTSSWSAPCRRAQAGLLAQECVWCSVLYCTALQSRNEHVAKSKAPEFVWEFLLSFVKLAVGHCENEVFSLL